MKINYKYLPLKAHYFFFMATMGAMIPFLPVYGKQLGVSAIIMSSITVATYLLFVIFKPVFGLLTDYFHTQKKFIFMSVLIITSGFFILLYFLPLLPERTIPNNEFKNISCSFLSSCDYIDDNFLLSYETSEYITCDWICEDTNFTALLRFHIAEETAILLNTTCLLNVEEVLICAEGTKKNYNCIVTCSNFKDDHNLYTSISFWGYVFVYFFAHMGFSTSLSTTESLCLTILGENAEKEYGKQRLWSEIGSGLAALLSGYTVDVWSNGKAYKTYTPAFLLVIIFLCLDLFFCRKLELPRIPKSPNIFAELRILLNSKSTVIFLIYGIIAGGIDGYNLSFLLWYVEDLGVKVNCMDHIKLIEGLIVAAQCFGSGVICMLLYDKILQKLGYGYTLFLSMVSYAIRLGLISVAPTPWWIIPIEFLLLGPSVLLSYATIIAFVNAISSSNVSISVQGIVGGLKEGVGMSIGNIVGGILLKMLGGALTFQIFSIFLAFSALVYILLYVTYLKHYLPEINDIEWRTPDDARKHCDVPE